MTAASDILTTAITGSSISLQQFIESYSDSPELAFESAREIGKINWEVPSQQTTYKIQQASDMEVDDLTSDGALSEGSVTEDDIDDEATSIAHLMHPDDIVFMAQRGVIDIAEVIKCYASRDAEMLGNNMLSYNYLENIENTNGRSMNMYNWMVHMQGQPLCEIVQRSDKLVSTKDWDYMREELIHMRVMERIDELKEKGKWSFWQPQKHRAPPRGKAHWDYLLDEALWMHADFSEERKLRVAMARTISSWVMDYHYAKNKKLYTVRRRKHLLPDAFFDRAPASNTTEQSPLPSQGTLMTENPDENSSAVATDNVGSAVDALSVESTTQRSPPLPAADLKDTDTHDDDGSVRPAPESNVSSNTSDVSEILQPSGDAANESTESSGTNAAAVPTSVNGSHANGDSAPTTQNHVYDTVLTGTQADTSPNPAHRPDDAAADGSEPMVKIEPSTESGTEAKPLGEDDTPLPADIPESNSAADQTDNAVEGDADTPNTTQDRNVSTLGESGEDHVVPTGNGGFDNSLSVFQILAQLPQTEQMETILGDSIYALQSLSSLMPYGPAWDDTYCDVLDASPVVPICKTMWPDYGIDSIGEEDGMYYSSAGDYETMVDSCDLVSFGGDDTGSLPAMESDGPGARSIFTRNFLAPPLLPMFTQANKNPRMTHSTTGQPPADTPIQQATSEACPGQVVFEWSPDRDKMLAKIIQQFTGNWPLITETFNHVFSLYGSRAITSRLCFERWAIIKEDYSLDRTVVQTGFDEPEYGVRKSNGWSKQLTVGPNLQPLSAMQLATSIVSHSEVFKLVSSSKSKRESASKPTSVPPREIKPLAADQKVPTPAELSRTKYDQDRRLQQLLLEQRQATAAATASALAMQQNRAFSPQVQILHINRQIATLQALL
ncbi:chromatin modification- protein VID21, partial [Coemansia erecta]